jgi:hypothetical protein
MRSLPAAASFRAICANPAEVSALRNSALQRLSEANAWRRGRASRPSPPPAVGFARIKSATCDEKGESVDTGALCCRSQSKLSIELPEQLQRELHLPRRCGRTGDRAAVSDATVGLLAVAGVNTMRFGVLKFARFSRLKISARNCRFRTHGV